MKLGDVMRCEGRRAVCVNESPFVARVLGTDRFMSARGAPSVPVESNIADVVHASLRFAIEGVLVVVGRLPAQVSRVRGSRVELALTPEYERVLMEIAGDKFRARAPRPVDAWFAAPRIAEDGTMSVPARSIFLRHPCVDLLWHRSLREAALRWFTSRPAVLAEAALEADDQYHLAPIRATGGRFDIGWALAPSPDDQWVAKRAVLSVLAWAKGSAPNALGTLLAEAGEQARLQFVTLALAKASLKWEREVVARVATLA